MKVGIYSEFFAGDSLGGREFIVAVLAEMFAAAGHEVEFVHHEPKLSEEQLAARFGLAPGTLRLRLLPARSPLRLTGLWSSLSSRQAWRETLNSGYDCFINIVHGCPVHCHAPRGILIVLFPFFKPFDVWAGREVPRLGRWRLWVLSRYIHYRLGWAKRMRRYQLQTSISRYVQAGTAERWRLKTQVLYPPSGGDFRAVAKRKLIFSVGRFTGASPHMVNKRQIELMGAFAKMARETPSGWTYRSLGGAGDALREREYVDAVRKLALAADGRAEVCPNAGRDLLRDTHAEASIFWHAADYLNDDKRKPELSEHYGIATVDAMSAGCVPVVARRGAQPEIVEHGVSGFLWDTLDELESYTRQLMNDPERCARMSVAAQSRSQLFSREQFASEFWRMFRETFGEEAPAS